MTDYFDGRYHAVDKWTLVRLLGKQCSPMKDRDGYLIGPDVTGRTCHCATHWTVAEAQKAADASNKSQQMRLGFGP